ncbi:uncharacterized protein LOC123275532 [Cotesia glomerata]|uniref:Uncharacterized protein n=1 Tax=Cotesia glomerata TaxID=32391 RepID=A0AAV7HZE4_COTGL|nr:uncharacterized protein LOC123275532 [Cotesia glomerata]KAH0539665.1 hypothetical protein KQX54_007083 [Cotesia glomerata]
MSHYYSDEDYEEMVKLYKKNKKNASAASREFAALHPDYPFLPKGNLIRRAVERKFRTRQAAPEKKMWMHVDDIPKGPSRPRSHMSKRMFEEIMGIAPEKKKPAQSKKKAEPAKKNVPARAEKSAKSQSQLPKQAGK